VLPDSPAQVLASVLTTWQRFLHVTHTPAPGRDRLAGIAGELLFLVAEAQQKRNQVTDGRIAVARMIGMGDNSRVAHVAMMELAAAVCRPALPDCTRCPLARWCASDRTAEIALSQLPLEDPSPDAN